MTLDELAAYALGKPGAWPDIPWEDDRVAKVGPGAAGAKIFAFLGDGAVGVKCGTGRDGPADEWLDRYPDDASVMAYIGRSGWNDLAFGGAIPDDELLEAVDESYRLVCGGLAKKLQPEGWAD